MTPSAHYITKIVPQVAEICIRAGSAILAVYNRPGIISVTEKDDRSPLTEADLSSHEIITKALSELKVAGETLPVMSEEGSMLPFSTRAHWKRYWLVDPLDGTKEFLRRNGEFTVNVALIEERMPVAGFIYIPTRNELFVGIEDVGAVKVQDAERFWKDPFKNGSVIAPRPAPQEGLRVLTSRSHFNDRTEKFIEHAERVLGTVHTVNRGSSGKFCALAEGSADLYPRFGPTMEWDTAAGDAICRAVGLEVRQIESGSALAYNKEDLHNPEFIAGSKNLIGELC